MDSIYFNDPLGLLIELASYRFEPPAGHTHADVLLEAHRIRVAAGDYNIAPVHLADAIERLVAARRHRSRRTVRRKIPTPWSARARARRADAAAAEPPIGHTLARWWAPASAVEDLRRGLLAFLIAGGRVRCDSRRRRTGRSRSVRAGEPARLSRRRRQARLPDVERGGVGCGLHRAARRRRSWRSAAPSAPRAARGARPTRSSIRSTSMRWARAAPTASSSAAPPRRARPPSRSARRRACTTALSPTRCPSTRTSATAPNTSPRRCARRPRTSTTRAR